MQVAVLLAAAMGCGVLAARLGQSAIVGYLIAGLALGPGALGVVDDTDFVGVLGELGIALLLFAVGLELPVDKLRRIGARPFLGGLLQTFLLCVGGTAAGMALGLNYYLAFVIAAGISLSSTAVTLRTLADRAERDAPHGTASLGLLIAQDIAVIIILLLVPELAGDPSIGAVIVGAGHAALIFSAVVAATIVLELALIRRVFSSQGLHAAREQIVAVSLATALAAIGACAMLGLSPALGGFVAGTVMAGSHYSDQVRAEVAPVRMVLTVLFFSWVGSLANVGWVAEHLPQVLTLAVVAVGAKTAGAALSLRLVGIPWRTSLPAGFATAQLGEFSFAVFAVAYELDLLGADTFQLLIGASIITILVSPTITALAVRAVLPSPSSIRRPQSSPVGARAARTLVVGLGPAGLRVCEALTDEGESVVAIELNPRPATVPDGVEVQFGDAAREEVLDGLGFVHLCIVTVPDPRGCIAVVSALRRKFPDVTIVARARYHLYVDEVEEAGADICVDEELQVGSVLAARAVAAARTA